MSEQACPATADLKLAKELLTRAQQREIVAGSLIVANDCERAITAVTSAATEIQRLDAELRLWREAFYAWTPVSTLAQRLVETGQVGAVATLGLHQSTIIVEYVQRMETRLREVCEQLAQYELGEMEACEPMAWAHPDGRMSADPEQHLVPGTDPEARLKFWRELTEDAARARGDARKSRGSCRLADEPPAADQARKQLTDEQVDAFLSRVLGAADEVRLNGHFAEDWHRVRAVVREFVTGSAA